MNRVAALLLVVFTACDGNDAEVERELARAFAASMGVQRMQCRKASWAMSTMCDGVLGERPVTFSCMPEPEGCRWWHP